MDLDSVLKRMEQAEEQIKTAAAPVTPEVGALANALEKAAGAPPPSAERNVVTDLLKMAENLAGTEKEAELSHASMMGQAFADAAIAKFAAYDAQVKIALAQDPNMYKRAEPDLAAGAGMPDVGSMSPDELEELAAQYGYDDVEQFMADLQSGQLKTSAYELSKVAAAVQQDSMLLKQAAEAGYDVAQIKIAEEAGYKYAQEKVAEQYKQGFDDALVEVRDLAAQEFLKGAEETRIMVERARAATR